MVKVYVSDKHPNYFHTVYSGNVTNKDDESYSEEFLKPFLIMHKEVVFVSEFNPECFILNKNFFDASSFDQLDPLKRVKEIHYVCYQGIHKHFIQKYIDNFPCDYVTHQLFDTQYDYLRFNKINFERDFKCIYTFEDDSDL